MKEEYDFSKGERGKFYHPDAELYLPIYLDPEVTEFLRKVSVEKGVEITTIVNDWVKKNISLIKTVI
jgi:succinyl-CoA synthetase beta subunit